MRLLLSFFCTLFCCFSSVAQDKLVFSYDTAGNQVLRDRICVGCSSQPLAATTEDVIFEELAVDPELSELSQPVFTAYPNPVTDILQTYWENTETEYIVHMSLHSFENKQLFSKGLSKKEERQDFNFGGYPPGIYVLNFIYNTNRKESYKIIKK
jgi:hypothetical protein